MSNYLYAYSGKPDGEVKVTERWKPLAFPKHSIYVPPVHGRLDTLLYLNLRPMQKIDTKIRLKVVREGVPDDDSAFQDVFIPSTYYGGSFLHNHLWFEDAEADRPLHWEIQGSRFLMISTRYVKWSVIPKEDS